MKHLVVTTALFFCLAGTASATYFNSNQLAPNAVNGNCLTTNGTANAWNSCGSGGSSATTTINSLSSLNYTFQNLDGTVTIATSAPGTITLGTSGLQPAGNYVTNSYASSTFPSFTYGTSTYATILSYPNYSYASSTYPSFTYGTSTYATILNYPTYTYGTATYATILNYPTYAYASSSYATLWNLKAGTNITISTSSGVTINGAATPTMIGGGTASGPAFTLATSTDTNLGVQIVCSSSTCTYTPQWIGTLGDSRITSAATWNAKISSVSLTAGATISGSSFTFASSSPSTDWNIVCATSTCTFDHPNNLLTGNQTITLSGAVTGSGATSIATVFQPAAFATGTTGNIFNIATTTTSLTINLPTASASNSGQLSSTDWSTFNNKVPTSRQVTGTSGLTGGGDLSADRTITLVSPVVVANGGTATTTTATVNGQLLGWNNASYGPVNLLAGANVTVTTTTPGNITIGTTGLQPAGTYVTAVTASFPLISSGGTTPNLTFQNLTTADVLFGQGTGVPATSTTFTYTSGTDNMFVTNASSTNLSVATKAWIPALTNLTSNGFIKTGSGNGTLSVDTNTYLTTIGSGISAYDSIWNGSNALTQGYLYETGGLVGLNTTTPFSSLTVATQLASKSNLALVATTSQSSNVLDVFNSSGTNVMSIASSGKVTLVDIMAPTNPTIQSTSTGIGASAGTASVTGNDVSFVLTINTNTTPAANAAIVTVAFGTAKKVITGCTASPGGFADAGLIRSKWVVSADGSTVTLSSQSGAALTASTTFVLNVFCP